MKMNLQKFAAALLAFVATTALAVDPVPAPPVSEPAAAGLQVTLTTGAYKLVVPETAPTNTASGNPVNESFPASVVVYNRSNSDIPFVFPNAGSAERHFTFAVFDSAGTKVWQSDSEAAAAQVETPRVLTRGTSWKRLIQIPLRIKGTALPVGTYTVEASIDDAKKPIGASALFEVARPTTTPTTQNGIKGLVLVATAPPADGVAPVEAPGAGAKISISEIVTSSTPLNRLPFTWQGTANAEGKFQVNTPVGRFRVTAGIAQTTNTAPVIPAKSVEITVESGKYSDVTIHLSPVPPLAKDTGIKGLVLIAQAATGASLAPSELPLAGAPVRVEEIRDPSKTYDRPAFVWNGATNLEGRFQVLTPAGSYRVTARGPVPPAGTGDSTVVKPPTATVEVTVTTGAFTETTLHIAPPPPPPPTTTAQ